MQPELVATVHPWVENRSGDTVWSIMQEAGALSVHAFVPFLAMICNSCVRKVPELVDHEQVASQL